MAYSNNYNPLTKIQKGKIAQLATEAFNHQYDLDLIDAPGETKAKQLANWRHAQQVEAVGESSLTKCVQKDFLPLRAHFNSILGRDDKAFEDHLKSQPANDRAEEGDTTETRTNKIHLIEQAIKDTHIHPNYVLAIAKNKFRKPRLKNIADLTTDQLHHLLITTKERIRSTNKKKAVDLQTEAFTKALNLVDWHYQRASGKAYQKGKDSYQKAESLATTPQLKAIFQAKRQEKQH